MIGANLPTNPQNWLAALREEQRQENERMLAAREDADAGHAARGASEHTVCGGFADNEALGGRARIELLMRFSR